MLVRSTLCFNEVVAAKTAKANNVVLSLVLNLKGYPSCALFRYGLKDHNNKKLNSARTV